MHWKNPIASNGLREILKGHFHAQWNLQRWVKFHLLVPIFLSDENITQWQIFSPSHLFTFSQSTSYLFALKIINNFLFSSAVTPVQNTCITPIFHSLNLFPKAIHVYAIPWKRMRLLRSLESCSLNKENLLQERTRNEFILHAPVNLHSLKRVI